MITVKYVSDTHCKIVMPVPDINSFSRLWQRTKCLVLPLHCIYEGSYSRIDQFIAALKSKALRRQKRRQTIMPYMTSGFRKTEITVPYLAPF